jgi:hypothetical protein
MPVTEDNVGYSEYTELKIYNFKKIAEMHVKICQGIISRKPWCDSRYFYMDLTAGTGVIPDTDLPNCGRVMIDTLRSTNIQFQAHLIDQFNADTLRSNLGPSPALYYYNDDHNLVMKDIIPKYVKKPSYGLMFYDPNSPGIVNGNWESLNSIAEIYSNHAQLGQVDFMMYLSGTAIKRVRHLTQKKLQDWLAMLHKKYWVVRKPKGAWQWTFILGTNWDAYPKIRSIGFYPKNTEEGKDVFDTINLTSEELQKMRSNQLSLFDLIGQEN